MNVEAVDVTGQGSRGWAENAPGESDGAWREHVGTSDAATP